MVASFIFHHILSCASILSNHGACLIFLLYLWLWLSQQLEPSGMFCSTVMSLMTSLDLPQSTCASLMQHSLQQYINPMESSQSPHSSSLWVFALSAVESYRPPPSVPISHLGTKLSSTVLLLFGLRVISLSSSSKVNICLFLFMTAPTHAQPAQKEVFFLL